jgi:hypothetical protein
VRKTKEITTPPQLMERSQKQTTTIESSSHMNACR